MLAEFGFQDLKLQCPLAAGPPQNERSLRVIKRLGLSYIGDRIHAELRHRCFALNRSGYPAAGQSVIEQPEP